MSFSYFIRLIEALFSFQDEKLILKSNRIMVTYG